MREKAYQELLSVDDSPAWRCAAPWRTARLVTFTRGAPPRHVLLITHCTSGLKEGGIVLCGKWLSCFLCSYWLGHLTPPDLWPEVGVSCPCVWRCLGWSLLTSGRCILLWIGCFWYIYIHIFMILNCMEKQCIIFLGNFITMFFKCAAGAVDRQWLGGRVAAVVAGPRVVHLLLSLFELNCL